MIYLEVAVAAPLFSTLTYLLRSEEREEGVGAGSEYIGYQVLVPLGRRTVSGYILGRMVVEKVEYSLKYIREIVSPGPLFHANMVPFFRWVADYYQFPLGEVITTALPAGLKRSSNKVLRLKEDSGLTEFLQLNDQPPWFEELSAKKSLSPAVTRSILADPQYKKYISRLLDEGIAEIEHQVSERTTREKMEICYSSTLDIVPPDQLDGINSEQLREFGEKLRGGCQLDLKLSEIKVLYYYARHHGATSQSVPQKEILRSYKGGSAPLKSLCEYGILKKSSKRIYRNPLGEIPEHLPRPERLTKEQESAVKAIGSSIEEQDYAAFLLHGVTGSGKTEVYLQSAQACLDTGRDVLVLVPEIALATQLEAHFLSRFGEGIALLHSGLSQGEKYDQWSLAVSGQARIVIGARSAVFAPLQNPGLIIVDEEHDGGFKQDDGLKYNGRDLAVLRAKLQNCTVVLGSATPSVTSYFHAKNKKYQLLTMPGRVGGSELPQVEVIDVNKDQKKNKKSIFHQRFIDELEKNLEKQEQSLVLINRRGFSASYICRECGTAVQCRHCNVTLTYHKGKQSLICHYCGYSVGSRLICSTCHSDTLVPVGIGTERIEEELRLRFPSARIERLDSDTASDRKKFLLILKAMRLREIDILIGTQMIAKGHHFPHVTFVGVAWADGGLNMPDFRAAERTYQLLSQVTGRSGRGEKKGRVIIQTMRPNHYAIELARRHQYEEFFKRETTLRQRPVFPPYVRLACYRISGKNEYEVRKTSEKIAAACRGLARGEELPLEVLGPATSPLEKIKDKYRWQILLKSPRTSIFHQIGSHIGSRRKDLVIGKTHITLDVDPENMM
ncbi:replication restart helicase PriA [Desulfopila inferna]|uniref:replication restart helicase PriA n=1 Tax=Desulfopila inferna TaxID=468528 RepID=UPI001962D919|nr:primosomal protein N' [Desulfopila inferna]MBM9602751.1 primosomal protein N' [Desulfopila inferna]